MKAVKESSQTVHTVTIELTDKEFSQLVIDQRALTPGFPALQTLVNGIREAIQPKPVMRGRTTLDGRELGSD